MTTDALGNPVTVATPANRQAVDDFVLGFLGYEPRAVNALAAADAAPDCGILQSYAAWLWMFAEAEGAAANARPYADRALALGGTDRETLLARIAMAWVEDDIPALLDLCDAVLADHPRDLATLKLAQYHLFNRGDCLGMLRVAARCREAAADAPWVHAMAAFGYEQCHLMPEAEAAARAALALKPDEPWAHHALAHVMLTEGRIDEGIAFLEGVAPGWAGLNSFMQTHNWWHLALFYISRDRRADALAVHDRHVWGIEKGYSQDQVGAVSLLARLELAGISVGDRWDDVADRVAARGPDTVNPFLTMQYLYALARTGRPEAQAMLTAVELKAAGQDHDAAVWAEVALPACRGLAAHAAGDWEGCVAALGLALPRLVETGGSHAQRDLFEQIHLDALIRAGRLATAQQVLEMRRGYDPDGVPVNRMLARIYAAAGLDAEAAKAEARAERTLAANP